MSRLRVKQLSFLPLGIVSWAAAHDKSLTPDMDNAIVGTFHMDVLTLSKSRLCTVMYRA